MKSASLFERAQKVTPGGVNSPVRAWKSVGGTPLFIERGEGPFLFADGRRYIDYVLSWGPLIFGHCPPFIADAVGRAIERGTSFGAPTDLEVEMAELMTANLPNVDLVRFVNSGTEATMSAIRLARGYTGRDVIIKCDGCYHSHGDSFLVVAGSGVATLGISGSPGVPREFVEKTVSVEFNDLELLEMTIQRIGPDKVAAIIVEPVPGNMGLVPPKPGYLQGIRELCDRFGIVFIVDEVMTGFRIAFGGAQELFRIRADLLTYGKIIGGGLPVGAFGGRRDIMEKLAPVGPVYQAGTLSGNPLAMSVGIAMLRELLRQKPYERLEQLGRQWAEGIKAAATTKKIALQTCSIGSMVGLFFSNEPVTNFSEAKRSNVQLFNRFFHAMIERGVYLAPSAFEAGFISTAHTPEIIDETIVAGADAFSQLA